ncbi:hypothetical protein NT04LS_2838 [Listeria seeligeri FSL S4-171]|nr:hypothetical protein NT04LS_2838 [Listeria seeligeri FSL S4-171]
MGVYYRKRLCIEFEHCWCVHLAFESNHSFFCANLYKCAIFFSLFMLV